MAARSPFMAPLNILKQKSFTKDLSMQEASEASQLDGILDDQYDQILYCFISIAIVVGVLGAIANILIILTFAKIGMSKSPSINISYLSLAVSDLLTCITTVPWAILMLPDFDSYSLLPVISKEIIIPIASWPALAFTKTTMCITAWVALERCLCVVFPMDVKSWITRRRTVAVIVIIYVITILPMLLINAVFRYEWKTPKDHSNKTVLGVRRVHTPEMDGLYNVLLALYGLFYQWIPLTSIIICTFYLINYLRENSKRRGILRTNESAVLKTTAVGVASQEAGLDYEDGGKQSSLDFSSRPDTPREQSTSIDPKVLLTKEQFGENKKPDELTSELSGISALAESVNEPDTREIKERRVIKAVLLVAIFSIIFTTPPSMGITLYIVVPELRPLGPYDRLNKLVNLGGGSLMMFNACFNIFIYYSLGTRFRLALNKIFSSRETRRLSDVSN